MIGPSDHWRQGERPIAWVEAAVSTTKRWGLMQELPPSRSHVTAFEADVSFVYPSHLNTRGALWLRAHEELDGQVLINLWLGNIVLRRAHIGANHQDPDNGPLVSGPHIHFPTSAFPNIAGRGSRSRAYCWDVDMTLSIRETIDLFALHTNIVFSHTEQQRLTEGPDELRRSP